MVLELYIDDISPPCRSVMAFYKMNNIPHEIKPLSVLAGDHKKEDFKSLCPIARVPLLKDSATGMILTESVVMMQLAAQKFALSDNWFPKLATRRARIMEYCMWHQSTGLRSSTVLEATVLNPMMNKIPVNETKLKADVEKLEKALNIMETYFMKDHAYLAGDDISIADLCAYPSIMTEMAVGYPVGKDRPKLTAWLDVMQERVGPHDAAANDKMIKLLAPYKRESF